VSLEGGVVRRLTTYADARDAFRQRELRQALYDDGHRLMAGVIVNLHGPEHTARRRLENRLFRRDTFAWYEAEVIPAIVARALAADVAAGHGDLLPLARRTMMTLSLDVAGVDHDGGDDLVRLDHVMDRLARASTVAHASGGRDAIVAAGDEALATFARRWFEPSRARRAALVAAAERGEVSEEALPRDVLTTLLRNQDRLDLPPEVVLREVAYFPWVGSHSTSHQFVHAMHHVFTWLAEHSGDRGALVADPQWRQRFVHESLRLHPASPVSMRHVLADVTLRSGTVLRAGEVVAIDLVAANRDPLVFGPDADQFVPGRALPAEVAPWGLSFGHGMHACLGQDLAGGSPPGVDGDHAALLGAVTVLAGAVLAAGARPDPDDPAELDTTTTRTVFARYPVRYG
jgi:cytochrome P450